jgi:hypothetical protein
MPDFKPELVPFSSKMGLFHDIRRGHIANTTSTTLPLRRDGIGNLAGRI